MTPDYTEDLELEIDRLNAAGVIAAKMIRELRGQVLELMSEVAGYEAINAKLAAELGRIHDSDQAGRWER